MSGSCILWDDGLPYHCKYLSLTFRVWPTLVGLYLPSHFWQRTFLVCFKECSHLRLVIGGGPGRPDWTGGDARHRFGIIKVVSAQALAVRFGKALLASILSRWQGMSSQMLMGMSLGVLLL